MSTTTTVITKPDGSVTTITKPTAYKQVSTTIQRDGTKIVTTTDSTPQSKPKPYQTGEHHDDCYCDRCSGKVVDLRDDYDRDPY